MLCEEVHVRVCVCDNVCVCRHRWRCLYSCPAEIMLREKVHVQVCVCVCVKVYCLYSCPAADHGLRCDKTVAV